MKVSLTVADSSQPSIASAALQNWPKVGVEIELLAPRGRSRKDLADAIASDNGGYAQRVFYRQSEYVRLDEAPIFENLTLGFEARARDDALLARCVDDLTLVEDLNRGIGPEPGWYRILSDDKRLLSLVEECCDPAAPMTEVLKPLARLFNAEPEIAADGGFVKVSDRHGASIALCASLPGERQRPCELITPPLRVDRDKVLQRFLALASELEFSIPVEAATHIHFDGAALESAKVLASVIAVFGHYRTALRQLVGTNPKCTRLGGWSKEVYRTVGRSGFAGMEWSDAANQLRQAGPVKFCDFNFINLIGLDRNKRTFEVRILPGSMDADFISRSIRLFEAMLLACVSGQIGARKKMPAFDDFLTGLELGPDHEYWASRVVRTTGRRFGF